MKGLLLKDYYIIRSLLAIMFVVYLVIGASLSYLVNPWVLTVLATVMSGMITTSTITVDKTSGWLQTVVTTPVTRKTFIDSKYTMYLLLSLAGLVFGILLGLLASAILGADREMFGLFICISITMTLLSGSVILPFYFLLDESKSMVGTILAYPLSAGILIVIVLLLGNGTGTYILSSILGACIFAVSWSVSKKILIKRDTLFE